jgi:hypothetical protein
MAIIQTIKELFHKTTNDKSAFHKFSFGKLTDKEIEEIKIATGFDLTGYERIVDSFGINHVIKNHFDEKTEVLRGQISIEIDDFEQIPEITSTPDIIENAGKSRIGKDLIKYIKQKINKLVYVEEIRTKRKEVAMQTFYKQKSNESNK